MDEAEVAAVVARHQLEDDARLAVSASAEHEPPIGPLHGSRQAWGAVAFTAGGRANLSHRPAFFNEAWLFVASAPVRSLEIEEDMAFQRRNWAVERIGWAAMVLLVLAAALGAFGAGPLSATTARLPDGALAVTYERLHRRSATSTIKVEVARGGAREGDVAVDIDRAFAESFRITEIRPPPLESAALSDGMRFRFKAAAGAPVAIYFHVTHEAFGYAQVSIGLEGQGRLHLAVFGYP